jgi:hypothetical protein
MHVHLFPRYCLLALQKGRTGLCRSCSCFVFVSVFLFFETGSYYVAQAGLELSILSLLSRLDYMCVPPHSAKAVPKRIATVCHLSQSSYNAIAYKLLFEGDCLL